MLWNFATSSCPVTSRQLLFHRTPSNYPPTPPSHPLTPTLLAFDAANSSRGFSFSRLTSPLSPSLRSVMFLQFVPKTHLFFTAGKDKKIKQWDADKFEHIQTLEVKLNMWRRHRSHKKRKKTRYRKR